MALAFPFNPDEVREKASERTKANIKRHSRDFQVMEGERIDPDLDGVAGEIVIPQIWPGAETVPLVGIRPDSGWDAKLTLDMKSTHCREDCSAELHLVVSAHQLPPKADFLGLEVVHWHNNTVTVAGYISRERFMEESAKFCTVCRKPARDGRWVHETTLGVI